MQEGSTRKVAIVAVIIVILLLIGGYFVWANGQEQTRQAALLASELQGAAKSNVPLNVPVAPAVPAPVPQAAISTTSPTTVPGAAQAPSITYIDGTFKFKYPGTWVARKPAGLDAGCDHSIMCQTTEERQGKMATSVTPQSGIADDAVFLGPNDPADISCLGSEGYCEVLVKGEYVVWTYSKNHDSIALAKSIAEQWRQTH